MAERFFKTALLIFIPVFLLTITGNAQVDHDEQHMLVSMRMIGHQILLNAGDSTSRVLPIEKKSGRYKIQFDAAFQFNPDELVNTIDSVVKKTNIANRYIVAVNTCATEEVIYSYEMGGPVNADIVPCGSRVPPKACYSIFISIFDKTDPGLGKGTYSRQGPKQFFNCFFIVHCSFNVDWFICLYPKEKAEAIKR